MSNSPRSYENANINEVQTIGPTISTLPGYFIFEGLEGSGKTTCINSVKERYEKENLPVKVIKEPGTTPLGLEVRRLINQPVQMVGVASALHLLIAARIELSTEILRSVGRNGLYYLPVTERPDRHPTLLLSDRGFPSTFALQSETAWSDADQMRIFQNIWDLHTPHCFTKVFPQAIIWLDLPHSTARTRALARAINTTSGGDNSHFDFAPASSYHSWYLMYEQAFRFFISKGVQVIRIDAEGSAKEVADRAYMAIRPLFYPENYTRFD